MNTTPADGTILKTDVLGRVKRHKEQREQLLDEFEKSGLSGQKFTALAGVRYSTFATWIQKRRRARGAYPAGKQPKQLQWLEAVVEERCGDQKPLVLELPGGARMEIKDAQQVALAAVLLRTLARPC